MTGFFSSATSNYLTEKTSFLIDWSRVGELLKSAAHRYSKDELIQRGFIIGCTGYGGYWGYEWAANGFGLGSCLYSMGGAFIGFVASHILVIAPLMYKRYLMSQECLAEQSAILSKLQDFKELNLNKVGQVIEKISSLVEHTVNLSLSDDKHSRASQTLGKRLSLMNEIHLKFTTHLTELTQSENKEFTIDKMVDFWGKKPEEVYLSLKEMPELKQELLDSQKIVSPN